MSTPLPQRQSSTLGRMEAEGRLVSMAATLQQRKGQDWQFPITDVTFSSDPLEARA